MLLGKQGRSSLVHEALRVVDQNVQLQEKRMSDHRFHWRVMEQLDMAHLQRALCPCSREEVLSEAFFHATGP